MTIFFFEPPPEQRVGGLDLAIRSLRSYLESVGIRVQCNPNPAELRGRNAIAHFHGLWQPNYRTASRYCRLANIPYVVSPHGMLEPWAWQHKWWKKWPYFWLIEKTVLGRACHLLATGSVESQNLQRSFPGSRIVSIPLGLNGNASPNYAAARHSLGWDKKERVLLFLGRLHYKKGLHLLLRSLVNLPASKRRETRLVIVGGGVGRYVDSLKGFAERRKHLLPRVEWVGEIWGDKKWPYLQGADLFCLPSYSENFGFSILEAAQVGTPVLTTRTTAWSNLNKWGCAYIGNPSVESTRENLDEFFESPRWSHRQRHQMACRVQEEFSWSQVGPRYVALYEEILK